ncbi:MAG: ATP-binding cassette domain-containing protein [Patescibacteria group bacterium]
MINFNEVSKHYPDGTAALEGVNFGINPGEFVFIVGPSGAGKTTLVKLLTREEQPTAGSVYFGETDLAKLRGRDLLKHRRELGVVHQDYKLLPYKTAYENVALALEVLDRPDSEIEEIVPHVLSLVGLENRGHHFPHQLSGGERQRLAFARALAPEPKALVADEPTGNVDPESGWGIVRMLEKVNEMGTTVLIATHAPEFVNKLGRRVIALEGGKLVRDQKKGKYAG